MGKISKSFSWLVLKFYSVASLGGLLVSIQHKTILDEEGTTRWEHACSGTLILADKVLTCSSCLTFDNDGSYEVIEKNLVRVYSGDKNPDLADEDHNGQIIFVSRLQNHPDYVPGPNVDAEYDFGIVITEKKLTLGPRLKVTQLYSNDISTVRRRLKIVNKQCKTMTWDFYQNGERQNSDLKGVWIDVLLRRISECSRIRNDGSARMNQTLIMEEETEDDFLMCVISLLNHPICLMDPGSPIICEEKIIAVVSNIGLMCDRGVHQVVVTGISNAIGFLTEPASLDDPWLKKMDHHHGKVTTSPASPPAIYPFLIILELSQNILSYYV